jgi:hypothetical protein
MDKFVASVVAGVIATVLGGLILNHLNNPQGQKTVPHVTAPLPEGFVRDQPEPPAPAAPQRPAWFTTYAEAEYVCGKDRVLQMYTAPNDRYVCN